MDQRLTGVRTSIPMYGLKFGDELTLKEIKNCGSEQSNGKKAYFPHRNPDRIVVIHEYRYFIDARAIFNTGMGTYEYGFGITKAAMYCGDLRVHKITKKGEKDGKKVWKGVLLR